MIVLREPEVQNGVVQKLEKRYYSAKFNDEGSRDEESKSWGKRDIVSDGEDNAELVYDNDPRCWHDVDNGDGFGDQL